MEDPPVTAHSNRRKGAPDYGNVRHYVTPDECPSGKRLYPSRGEAKTAARQLRDYGNGRLDAYRCRDGCDGFHIGHHTKGWA